MGLPTVGQKVVVWAEHWAEWKAAMRAESWAVQMVALTVFLLVDLLAASKAEGLVAAKAVRTVVHWVGTMVG